MAYIAKSDSILKNLNQTSTAKLCSLFKKFKLKFWLCSEHLFFNNNCKRNHIIPNYIQVKINNQSTTAEKVTNFAKWIWLIEEIRSLNVRCDNYSFSNNKKSVKVILFNFAKMA